MSQIDISQYSYSSNNLLSRQHHLNGNENLLYQIFSHFSSPINCSDNLVFCPYIQKDQTFMAHFSYLTQIYQAITLQVQTEHYRRWKGNYDNIGRGNTMCALYWQLNDVWTAPTWSSIDYNLEWKMAHYFIKKSFSKIIISMFLDENANLNIFVISDFLDFVSNVFLQVELLSFTNGFDPIERFEKIIEIPANNSTKIDLQNRFQNLKYLTNNHIFKAKITGFANMILAPISILHPNKFNNIKNTGKLKLNFFYKIDDLNYEFLVQTTKIVPFIWIDLTSEYKKINHDILFRFSDNGFTLTEPQIVIILKLTNKPITEPTLDDLTICHLLNCFLPNE